jgi:ectoine hydroxylase-related dioxygenase (phytanoyl-CoA dioxygenase family)|tara:strand:+ start:15924 stop:16718 length:795 start_codon:yes stop_codon:yes gene_type:complete
MDKIKETYLEDGVVLLKNVWDRDTIEGIVKEYDRETLKILREEIPKDQPVIVLWQHVEGGRKKIGLFSEFPKLWSFIKNIITPKVRKFIVAKNEKLRLLETVIFNKPYNISNKIHWHQDTSTWPLKPNNQFAVWIPFEEVDKESGALHYALGSHKNGIKCSVNLSTNEPYKDDKRKLIPSSPENEGFIIKCMEMNPTDMLCHHGNTWHSSEPNKKSKRGRRALTVRFIVGDIKFDPNPGQAATFVKQIEIKKGEKIEAKAFPSI